MSLCIGRQVYPRCCHGTWWIIPIASVNPLWAGFSPWGSPDRPPFPEVRPHPTSSAGTLPTPCTTWHFSRIRLAWRSSGNRWQGTREHLACRPSSVRSSRRHGWRPLPIALREQSAPSLSWLHERYPQRFMRTDKMIIGSPPLQMGEQGWGLLCRRPGAACKRCHPMTDRQIHPLDERRVQPP